MLNPLHIALALALCATIAFVISTLIIAIDDRRERLAQAEHEKRLADIRNGNTPDAISHKEFMQRMNKILKETQTKLDALR